MEGWGQVCDVAMAGLEGGMRLVDVVQGLALRGVSRCCDVALTGAPPPSAGISYCADVVGVPDWVSCHVPTLLESSKLPQIPGARGGGRLWFFGFVEATANL